MSRDADDERCASTVRLSDGTTTRCENLAKIGARCWEHLHEDCLRAVQNQRTCWGCGSTETASTISCTCPCRFAKVIWPACEACAKKWTKPIEAGVSVLDEHLFPGLFPKARHSSDEALATEMRSAPATQSDDGLPYDEREPPHCRICSKTYDDCDCAQAGRR